MALGLFKNKFIESIVRCFAMVRRMREKKMLNKDMCRLSTKPGNGSEGLGGEYREETGRGKCSLCKNFLRLGENLRRCSDALQTSEDGLKAAESGVGRGSQVIRVCMCNRSLSAWS